MATKEYFPEIGKIKFEGKESKNPMAFHYYDPEKVILGKKMKDWLKFSMAWWHTLCAEADTIEQYEANLKEIVAYLKKKQEETGIKLLWGTANVFGHARYMNGAATNPDFDVVARAAVQIKNAIDATIELGGTNYVFWGGREGYMSLLNTDQKREKEHLAIMLRIARDYARSKGFTGTFLIEPKPMEPTKHQYDADTETVIGFLKTHGLDKDFKVNIEVNHATLAGHTFEHELAVAVDNGMLGSIDANRGDYQNGWDTATAVRTSTPRPAATPPTWRTSSSPTSAAWMLWHVPWRALPACSKSRPTSRCWPTVTLPSTPARARNSRKAS